MQQGYQQQSKVEVHAEITKGGNVTTAGGNITQEGSSLMKKTETEDALVCLFQGYCVYVLCCPLLCIMLALVIAGGVLISLATTACELLPPGTPCPGSPTGDALLIIGLLFLLGGGIALGWILYRRGVFGQSSQ